MTARYEIYMGCDAPHIDQESAEDLARHLITEAFPHGCSVRIEDGTWQMADGTVAHERTVVATWMSTDQQEQTNEAAGRVSRLAAEFKRLARQEAVLIVKSVVDAVFV